MSFAPVEGPYDEKIINLSKKIAVSYNESIENLNPNLFLGFEFKNIPELKNKRASLNFKNKILEVNINKETKIIIPSVYASASELSKFFEFKNERKFKDDIILQEIVNRNSIEETFRLKGKADSIFSGIKSGLKSAKKYFKSEITIQNPESVEELAANISSDLFKVLSIDSGKQGLMQVIENFIINEDDSSIDKLYNSFFQTSISTKHVQECIGNIKKLIAEKTKEGEIKGKIDNSDILDQIAKSYGVEKKDISSRNEKNIFAGVDKIYTYISKGISIMINALKGLTFSAAAYEAFNNGVGSLVTKIIKYTISGCLNVVQYFIQTSSEAVQMADAALRGDSSILDKVFAALTKANEFITGKGIDSIDYGQGWLLEKLSVVTNTIESLPYIGVIKYLLFVYFAIMALKYIYNIVKDLFKIKSKSQTDAEKLFARMSEENLTSNFGFDKILATESIITIIVSHLDAAIQSNKFSKEEKDRLKSLINAFYKSHKVKTKEGIRFFFKEIKG
tara:strand:- start:38 stop:1558 length:1521 start_codon:yes stop_codon:yes gene_type:complete